MSGMLRKTALTVSVMMLMSCVSCGKGEEKNPEQAASESYSDIVIGRDHTDLQVKLTVMTNRIDLMADDPNVKDYQDYKREFNALYPGIDVVFESSPDYDLDMTTRLGLTSWDVCFIPATLKLEELDQYFEPFCPYGELSDKYEFISLDTLNDQVYGIPSFYNAQGIVYNKKVWSDAGITEMPRTPDDFIDGLKKIKENTDAIPLYTNYAAGWTLTSWDYYDSGVTGDGRYRYYVMPYESDPFSRRDDGSGIYEVYNILYRAASEGLIEDDPASTNWELCKASINNGEIGCMVLGSWAVPQMQTAGSHADDIGYMPFPVMVDGVQYATAGANYSYGINNKISDEKKLAAKIFVKYLIENSGFALDQGGISIVKGSEYSDVFGEFDGVQLIMEEQSVDGEENVFEKLNEASGLYLVSEPDHIMRLIDSAVAHSESLDEIIADWNAAWTAAQQQYLSDN